jgi:hypothetical protein
MMKNVEDIRQFLEHQGWSPVGEDRDIWVKSHSEIRLTHDVIDLIDALYMGGWHGGLQRGLYETETLEDVEADDIETMRIAREEYFEDRD